MGYRILRQMYQEKCFINFLCEIVRIILYNFAIFEKTFQKINNLVNTYSLNKILILKKRLESFEKLTDIYFAEN